MEYIIAIVIAIIEMIAFLNIAQCFFDKKQKKDNFLLAFVFMSAVGCITNCFANEIVIKNMIIIVITCAFLVCFYDGSFYKKAILPILFLVLVTAIDFAVLFIIRMSWGISQAQATQSPVFFVFGVIVSRFFLFLFSYIAKRLHCKRTQHAIHNPKDWAMILAFLISALMNLYLLFNISITANQLDMGIAMTAVSIIFTTIGIFEITLKLEQQKRKEEDFDLLEKQMEFEMQKVSAAMELYNSQRKLTHDFKKHLTVLSALLNKNHSEKANAYIGNLLEIQEHSSFVVYSNHLVIDALLTEKYAQAKRNHITLDCVVDDLSAFPMQDTDIVIVLANLLDNAIEANQNYKGNKFISVQIHVTETQNILKVKNTMCVSPQFEQGEVITTKTNQIRHGFGMANVKEVLDKYGWHSMINIQNDTFEFIAIQLK